MTSTTNYSINDAVVRESTGLVYCPICTHTVHAVVEVSRRSARVKPGQRCKRCLASLDAAHVLTIPQAA
jgi:uncharacterized Zn finger protein (UPF0148 family)